MFRGALVIGFENILVQIYLNKEANDFETAEQLCLIKKLRFSRLTVVLYDL